MRLVLIRHGESEHSRRNLIAGPASCPGLTPRGRQQAERLAQRLRATGELEGAAVLLSSPVARARETAEILATLPGPPLTLDEGLLEVAVGEADGLTWSAYRATYGMFDLVAEPERPFAPGGESWNGFLARVRRTLDRLAARYEGRTVVAVTHAGFIVATALVAFAIPRPGTGARLEPAHTALTEWRAQGRLWELARYNDAAHLLSGGWPSDAGVP
jgi:broad specificity phosphatase PhoE